MKKAIAFTLLIALILTACKNVQKASQANHKKLHKLTYITQTPDSLLTSESVFYDKNKNLLYVSCINGKPLDKDSNGYISKVGLDGKIIKLHWIGGLNAPKGMGTYENKLYVTDIDRIAIIDKDQGKIIKFVNVQGAKFLNDIAVDSKGNVYISDSNNNLVYLLQNDSSVTVWLDNLKSANGLFIKGDTLFIGTKDNLMAANIKTKELKTIASYKTPMIDGLQPAAGGFITSDWFGKIYFIDTQVDTVYTMLNFPQQTKNAADLAYIPEKNLVIVPTFFDNRVIFYKFQ